MFPKIKILFIGAPSKATIDHQQLLASGSLPIIGQFAETADQAIIYLKSCSTDSFPDVILLDERLGKIQLDFFFLSYRRFLYMQQLDTLLFLQSPDCLAAKLRYSYSLIAEYLPQSLSKTIFIKEIYSRISFTVI